MYSTLDIMANLYAAGRSASNEGSGECFRKWVRDFLLPRMYRNDVTEADLWGARCGLLHSYESISSESLSGKAKEIQYFKATQGNLESIFKKAEQEKNWICLFVDPFLENIQNAVDTFEKWLQSPTSDKTGLAVKLDSMYVFRPEITPQGRMLLP